MYSQLGRLVVWMHVARVIHFVKSVVQVLDIPCSQYFRGCI